MDLGTELFLIAAWGEKEKSEKAVDPDICSIHFTPCMLVSLTEDTKQRKSFTAGKGSHQKYKWSLRLALENLD